MNSNQTQSSQSGFGSSVVSESMRYGPVITLLVMTALSGGLAYAVYINFLSGWSDSVRAYRQQIVAKENENRKTENMIAGEEQFKARFDKIVGLYEEAKPLLPEETEISDVLGQVEAAAQKNGVTLTGLMAVKESVKSPKSEKLYEREIPALVTGSYPQVVRFLADVSRMPRILVVRDYSILSLKNQVSAGFTLVAYHAAPPGEKPKAVPAAPVAKNGEAK